ncbi:unnamed protein product [Rotaria magnacalcarata]|uniref:Uncharacterized protein n=3 Tax=Rotaria magnacalcarata TaxID=392030 RepID=A0A814DPH0_9BILA|nr:unnamed protein product [Rotaria magnacalcarata]CAF1251191.1 unnamed protein product [Rotaria magnacalcarata]CAF1922275.1 unnamed protein product [Rotaria magnacalcarata]CAF4642079.1 unnamed protein product [Rotaria magnacalcarata]CAF4840640.1 unnamed protein product [Rotaria magnacalcarata]
MKTLFIFLLILPVLVSSGPLAYGACQTACNYGAVTCYSLAGLTFGVSTAAATATGPVGWWAWLTSTPTSTLTAAAACSVAQGTCMAACTPLLIAPTP